MAELNLDVTATKAKIQELIDATTQLNTNVNATLTAAQAALTASTAWFEGEGAPDNGTGVEGDVYLDTVAGRLYVKGASDWGSGTSLIGPVGPTPNLTIDTVTTLDPGEDATASLGGTPEDPTLSLGLPLPDASVIAGYKDDAEAAAGIATTKAAEVEASKTVVLNAEANSLAHANTAEGHKEAANILKNETQTIFDNATALGPQADMSGLSASVTADAVAIAHWNVDDWDDPQAALNAGVPARGVGIAHTSGLDLYDTTNPTETLYLDFSSITSNGRMIGFSNNGQITAIKIVNGFLVVTTTGDTTNQTVNGLFVIDLLERVKPLRYNSSGVRTWPYTLADRNQTADGAAWLNGPLDASMALPSNFFNKVALYLDPASPYDRDGMRMPTIFVGTGGGFCTIEPDGTISTAITSNVADLAVMDDYVAVAYASTPVTVFLYPVLQAARGDYTDLIQIYREDTTSGDKYPRVANSTAQLNYEPMGKELAVAGTNPANEALWVLRPGLKGSNVNQNLGSTRKITANYASSLLVGSALGAWLCDTQAGTVSGAELVTNGDFDGDFTGWTGFASTLSVESNVLRVTSDGATVGNKSGYQILTGLIPEKRYRLSAKLSTVSGVSASSCSVRVGNGVAQSQLLNVAFTTTDETITGTFVAEASSHHASLVVYDSTGDASKYAEFDNILVYEDDESLVTNETFEGDGSGAWSSIAGWSNGVISGGQWTWTNTGTYAGRGQNISGLVVGALYEIEVDVASTTHTDGLSVRVYVSETLNNPAASPILVNASITSASKRYFIATKETLSFGISSIGASDTIVINSAAVRKVENLVENGSFDTDLTGWSAVGTSTTTWNAGAMDCVRNEQGVATTSVPALIVGETYEFTWEIKANSDPVNGYAYWNISGMPATPQTQDYSAVGVHTWKFTAASNGSTLELYAGGVAGLQFTLDNITLRHIPNLVTNGTFDADTDWTKTEFTISGGVAQHTGTGTGILQQTGLGLTVGNLYRLTFTVSNATVGNVYPRLGAGNIDTLSGSGANGIHTYLEVAAADQISFVANTGFDGDINNVIVEPIPNLITGAPDLLSERASYANGTLTVDGSQATTNGDWTYWDIAVTPNQPLRFRLSATVTGTRAIVRLGDGPTNNGGLWNSGSIVSDTDIIVVPTQNTVRVAAFGDNAIDAYSITNIILEEVDQLAINGGFDEDANWTKDAEWSIANGVATVTGGGNKRIKQDVGFVDGELYAVTFDITSRTSGSIRVEGGDGSNGTFPNSSEAFDTVGTHTVVIRPAVTSVGELRFGAFSSANLSIDNVKVVPITDLVTNGSFDSTAAGWTADGTQSATDVEWEINEGQLIITRGSGSTAGRPKTNVTGLIVGETYKLEVLSASTTLIAVSSGFGISQYVASDASAFEPRIFVATATSGDLHFWPNTNETVSLDNVSVKRVIPDRTHNENHLPAPALTTVTAITPGSSAMWFELSDPVTVTLGADISSSGSIVWMEDVGGVPVHYVKDLSGGQDYVDGKPGTAPSTFTLAGADLTVPAGVRLSRLAASATVLSADQAKHAYETRFADPLGGTSSAVLSHSYDAKTDELKVLTSSGLSTFKQSTGVRTAFDAGAAGSPLISVQDEHQAIFDGTVVTLSGPPINLRVEAQRKPQYHETQTIWLDGDGTTAEFDMEIGHRVKAVNLTGTGLLRPGASEAYTTPSTGYRQRLIFDTPPGSVSIGVTVEIDR